ncbi:MAG: sigma-70 family RNA polymerase sigma factor [Bacteroidota bacterium]
MTTPIKKIPDNELVELLASHHERDNDRALRYLYATHCDVIMKMIYKNNGSEEEAKDVFQDGLIVLYNKCKAKDFQLRSSLQTFLFSICRNLWLMKLRSKKREVKLDDSFTHLPDLDDSILEVLVVSEREQLVAQLLNQLGEGCKQILHYFYFERLRMKAIMQLMKLSSEQVAKNKKANCMKKLRKLVLESGHFKQSLETKD